MSQHPHPDRRHAPAALIRVVISMLVVVGCATTDTAIEKSWRAAGVGPARFARVVALYDSEVGTTVRAAEDQLVRRLAAQGVQAVPAYAILSPDDRRDLERAKAKLRTAGYDGLIVMRVVDVEQYTESGPGIYDPFWGWSGPYYWPYLYTGTIVRIETAAYSIADNKLVWSSLSRTIDPDDTGDLVDEVTEVVAAELGKRGVVASREVKASREPPARL